MDKGRHFLVQQQGNCGQDTAFDQIEWSCAKDDVSIHAVDHWVDSVAGINDGFQRHYLRVEWKQHKFVCQSTYDSDGGNAAEYGDGSTFVGWIAAEQQRRYHCKTGQHNDVSKFANTSSLAGQHMNQVFDDSDIDCRQWAIHEAHQQNRHTAQINFQEWRHERQRHLEEHQNGGDSRKQANQSDFLDFRKRLECVGTSLWNSSCGGHGKDSLLQINFDREGLSQRSFRTNKNAL